MKSFLGIICLLSFAGAQPEPSMVAIRGVRRRDRILPSTFVPRVAASFSGESKQHGTG